MEPKTVLWAAIYHRSGAAPENIIDQVDHVGDIDRVVGIHVPDA